MTSTPSNDPNPYATATADDVRDLLVKAIGDDPVGDGASFFRSRAVALVTAVSPVLVWLRDHKGIQLDGQRCYAALGLREIATLWDRKVALVREPSTGRVQEVQAKDLPADLHRLLGAYLVDLPGYDPAHPSEKQQSDKVEAQHCFALFYLTVSLSGSTPASRAA